MKRKYRNAQDVLPDRLLRELQQYAAGETLYIPGIGEKKQWGEASGARTYYKERNASIREKYAAGKSVDALAEEYGLSVDSIRKIVN